ncbi:Integrase [Pararobbsia alpina]|uniref:tyrosine-type recombinase/integrase n=1 Tax=Pararobbsia alpina TaxID=621374 RepID=UPI0039A69180
MANSKQIHRLNALKIGKLVDPGLHPDGGGLYLQITDSGARSWIFRYSISKRARAMGLGPLSAISLAEARSQATDCRKQLAAGVDPIDARAAERLALESERSGAENFKTAAAEHIANQRDAWKNSKHAQQWENTLATYAYPVIGPIDVALIDTSMIVRILQPIWSKKPETASRVRGRIEAVLDSAKARGKRTSENPARWRGHLDKILPKRDRVRRVKHHPALPFKDIPKFMLELRAREGTSARALELTILTCARTSETLEAPPDEFDIKHGLWTVPAERMKMERAHRVPLVPRVVEIINEQLTNNRGPYLFPGQRKTRPLSNMAMLNLLERMGYDEITVHGFRSSFRDWVAECTEYADSLAEMALAHEVKNKVEGAYRRGDMLERRRQMMEDWARYCNGAQVLQYPSEKTGT